MPTALHRITSTPNPDLYRVIQFIAKRDDKPESEVLIRLAQSAVDIMEDMADAEIGDERLTTFDRKKALTLEEMRQWSKNRAKKSRPSTK